MSMDTKITRQNAHDSVVGTLAPKRRQLILVALEFHGPSTASELAADLWRLGLLPYSHRGLVAPRLTELEHEGLVRTTGRKPCQQTGRSEAIYEAVRA